MCDSAIPSQDFDQKLSSAEHQIRAIALADQEAKRAHPRPFLARGSTAIRCSACRLPAAQCICTYRVETQSYAQFWVIMHPEEAYKPTNTARLIGDVLPDTRYFGWYRTAPDAELLALLQDPRYQPFIIFPDDQEDVKPRVRELDLNTLGERIPVFILLDGTWRQARRIFRKSPYLADIPVLPLHHQMKTRYALRKPASEAHLCTAEAAMSLLMLSGDHQASEVLSHYFDVFNLHYAAARRHQAPGLAAPMRWLLDYQQNNTST